MKWCFQIFNNVILLFKTVIMSQEITTYFHKLIFMANSVDVIISKMETHRRNYHRRNESLVFTLQVVTITKYMNFFF